MKWILLMLFLFVKYALFSQELTINTKYGYAIGETTSFKKIMLYRGVDINTDWRVNDKFSLGVAAGLSVISFGNTEPGNLSVFDRRYFIDVPVSLKKYYPLSRKITSYVQFGLLNSFPLFNKREVFSGNESHTDKTRIHGYNLALLSNIGMKTIMDRQWVFGIALGGAKDFFSSYTYRADRIMLTKTALTVSFTKMLK